MNTSKRIHATKPQTKEFVGPALLLKHLQCEDRVIVDGVDDHLHQMDLVGLDLGFLRCCEDSHGHSDEPADTVVNVTR